MRNVTIAVTVAAAAVAALSLTATAPTRAQTPPPTLVGVFAHPDDEMMVGPVLARYAREGVRVHLIVATDGAQGGSRTTIPRGPELARARAEEMRCAAAALGAQPPILLEFSDGGLGGYAADPTLLFRLAERVQKELARLQPAAVVTWGPDGGYGHPDHRLIGDIVMQLARAGAPGVPERIFYQHFPAEGFGVMSPGRGAPPFLVPQAKQLSVRIAYTDADLATARRSMACHKTQVTDELVDRLVTTMQKTFNGVLPFVPAFATSGETNLLSRR